MIVMAMMMMVMMMMMKTVATTIPTPPSINRPDTTSPPASETYSNCYKTHSTNNSYPTHANTPTPPPSKYPRSSYGATDRIYSRTHPNTNTNTTTTKTTTTTTTKGRPPTAAA